MFGVPCPRNISVPQELKQTWSFEVTFSPTLLRDLPRRNGVILYFNMHEYSGTDLSNEIVNKVSLTLRGFHYGSEIELEL